MGVAGKSTLSLVRLSRDGGRQWGSQISEHRLGLGCHVMGVDSGGRK